MQCDIKQIRDMKFRMLQWNRPTTNVAELVAVQR